MFPYHIGAAFNTAPPPPPPWVQNANVPAPWQQPQPPVGQPKPLFPPQHDEPPPPPPPPQHQPSQLPPLHDEEEERREEARFQREDSGHKEEVEEMTGKVTWLNSDHFNMPMVSMVILDQGFIQDVFLGWGNVDAWNEHMHVSIHPLWLRFSWNSGHI